MPTADRRVEDITRGQQSYLHKRKKVMGQDLYEKGTFS